MLNRLADLCPTSRLDVVMVPVPGADMGGRPLHPGGRLGKTPVSPGTASTCLADPRAGRWEMDRHSERARLARARTKIDVRSQPSTAAALSHHSISVPSRVRASGLEGSLGGEDHARGRGRAHRGAGARVLKGSGHQDEQDGEQP